MRYIFRKYIFAHTIYAILSCFRKINELKNVGNLIIEPRGSRGEYNYCFQKERSIISSFQTDLKTGKDAEELFINRVYASPGLTLDDVRDNREYQRKDIDFIVHVDGDPKPYSVDVKYAGVDGGADLIETISNTGTGRSGWGHMSEADIIIYYKQPLHQFHFLEMRNVRAFLKNEDFTGCRRHYGKTHRSGVLLYESENIRVPYKILRKTGILYAEVPADEILNTELFTEKDKFVFSKLSYEYCIPRYIPLSIPCTDSLRDVLFGRITYGTSYYSRETRRCVFVPY